MGKNAILFLSGIIMVVGIFSLSPTASAFVDSTFGSEVEAVEYNCFNGEDDDSDGYTDFDDSDC